LYCGRYAVTVTDGNNCSAEDEFILTVIPSTSASIDSSICSGEVILINGNQISQAGVYVDSLIGQDGCDSLLTINLELIPLDSIYITEYSCQTIDTGLVQLIDISTDGCDSFTFIQTYLSPSDTTYEQMESCDISSIGLDTIFSINQYNCDSLHIIETTLLLSDTTYINEESCHLIDVGFDTISIPGQFCDSTIITETTFTFPDTFYIEQYTYAQTNLGCDSTTFIITDLILGDTIYNIELTCDQSLIGFDTTFSASPVCDTTIITEYILDVIPPVTINQSSCDPADIGIDTIYTQTNLGCDSTTYIITDLIQSDTIFNIEMTCDQSLIGFDTTFNAGTVCDTTVITEYILNVIPPVAINQSSCDPTDIGIDTIYAQTSMGCDSTTYIITDLILGDTIYNLEMTCDPMLVAMDTSFAMGSVCDTTIITQTTLSPTSQEFVFNLSCNPIDVGVDTLFEINQYGCDSLIIIETALQNCQVDTLYLTTCDINLAGISSDTLMNNGLPEISITVTEFIEGDTIYISESVCNLLQVGIDTLLDLNEYGCDSMTIISNNFNPSDTLYINDWTCDPNEVGIVETILSGNLCDTILYTTTNFYGCIPTEIEMITCTLDSVGVFFDTIPNFVNLDSIIITTVNLAPPDTVYTYESTCNPLDSGMVITTTLNGQNDCSTITYNYIELQESQFGCDSTIHLLVLPAAPIVHTFQVVTCDPDEIGLDTIETLVSFEGCDSLIVKESIFDLLETDIELEKIVCHEDLGSILAFPNGGTSPYLYSLNNSPLQSQNYFGNLEPGNYLMLIEDAEGCFEEIEFILEPARQVAVQLTGDVDIDLGETAYINAVTNMNLDTFFWQSQFPLSCLDCLSPSLMPLTSTQVGITTIDQNGCEAFDHINVRVRKEFGVYIPNAFSPNEDGKNDRFLVFANDAVQSIDRMIIHDRWGAQVFAIDNPEPGNYADGWDGKMNDRPLNPAVFVYYVEVTFIDGRKETFSGDVTLMK